MKDDKMLDKIGILALGRAENYGAVLQSYSLCRFVNENIGDCEVIDFVPEFIVGRYPIFKLNTNGFIPFIKSLIVEVICYPARKSKKRKFNDFRYRYASFSKEKYIKTVPDVYMKYIVGSDQVFNLGLTNNDIEFFLPEVGEDHNKITYAASLGVSSLTEGQKEIFRKYLSGFKNISIREYEGRELISEILPEKEILQHIDPVFLTSAEAWRGLIRKKGIRRPYIFIYAFKEFELAYSIAKSLNMDAEILCISESFIRLKKDVTNVRDAGPIDFLSLIDNAEYIITDSFHGTAFSVIFEKNFISIPYKGTESRFVSMLQTFGLEDRIYSGMDMKLDSIDYSLVEKKKEKQLESSLAYLRASLE